MTGSRSSNDADGDPTPAAAPGSTSSSRKTDRPIRVLIVEDNPGDADLTKETLEEGPDLVEVTCVIDGAQALALLLREPPYEAAATPDLILLDLNLPKQSGLEVLADIKRHHGLRRIPVVVLTSSDAKRDIVRAYELGAGAYVTKPMGLEAFQAVVHSIQQFWFRVVRLP